MNVVLLDYDGYVAKAFYAGYDESNPNNFNDCLDCLSTMESFIKTKADEFFQFEDYQVYKIMSGHSIKKDVYPSYKAQRKRDDALEIFRELIKESNGITIADNEEADDLIIRYDELKPNDTLVFSDDKDLHKYCKWTCKLGQNDLPNKNNYSKEAQLIQMITGDSCDNIKGVPQFGEAKAKKYLDTVGYTLDAVIRLYRTRKISIDECAKNLILVHPIAPGVLDIKIQHDEEPAFFTVTRAITKKVKEIYNEEN